MVHKRTIASMRIANAQSACAWPVYLTRTDNLIVILNVFFITAITVAVARLPCLPDAAITNSDSKQQIEKSKNTHCVAYAGVSYTCWVCEGVWGILLKFYTKVVNSRVYMYAEYMCLRVILILNYKLICLCCSLHSIMTNYIILIMHKSFI